MVDSKARRSPTERSPLLVGDAAPADCQPQESNHEDLPVWFQWAVGLSIAVSLAWLLVLVAAQRFSLNQIHNPLVPTPSASFYLYAGVFNSLLGSFLSASGYCCQKVAHNRVQRHPALGTASQQPVFIAGLFVLAVGTISAVVNLGILGQAVQAPFAALTLIYSALLGRVVLGEPLVTVDIFSSVLIVLGVAVDVLAARLADVPSRSYNLKALAHLLFRDSPYPTAYTIITLAYTTMILRRVYSSKLHRRAVGLLAFSSCAGIMAGFTSLATKSAVEVAKAALHEGTWLYLMNPFFVLILLAVPAALIPQLYFLNQGLEFFGTLKFVPLYQAFIILGNMGCGMVFYNEMASYSAVPLVCFAAGIGVTLSGVCLLLVKVDAHRVNVNAVDRLPTPTISVTAGGDLSLVTDFSFADMAFATDNVAPLRDFDECKRAIVQLLRSARTSIYYSTFLCDFSQDLTVDGDPDETEKPTIATLIAAAVKRGVRVHVLYNPVVDYGTATAQEVRRQLPRGVELACSVSDMGPSVFTRCVSNNSKYAFHHQKYLCVDEETIMVTGCDVNTERAGWLRANHFGYFWHELGVVAPCSPSMFRWIRSNHAAAPVKRHYDQFIDSPPFPLVAGGWREENAMVNLILNAQKSVQLENQILISGGSLQHNRICTALVTRIAAAHRRGEQFHVLLLTNAAQQDEPSQVTRWYCALSIQWSLEQLEVCAASLGMTRRDLARHVIVGRLAKDGVLIKVHSNILIVDGWYALRSSSNLADRSLSARPNDTELGLLFAGPRVAQLQQDLFNMYLSTSGASYSMEDVFHRVETKGGDPACCIVPLEKMTTWSRVLTWFLMNAFIYCSEGATGGRIKVTFATTVERDMKGDYGSADDVQAAVAC